MKKQNRVLSLVLALVLALSCMTTAFAAGTDRRMTTDDLRASTQQAQSVQEEDTPQVVQNTEKGFKSLDFLNNNAYQYKDDETVRAIVVLEGEPTVAQSSGKSRASRSNKTLDKQHAKVQDAIDRVSDAEMQFDFTTLLNGMSMDVPYGDLEAIAAIPGVETVYIANSYKTPDPVPPTDGSSEMTGAMGMWREGYTGEGQVIAVLDTGLNTKHEAFQVNDLLGDVALTEEDLKKVETEGQYLSPKVPFAYDYGDQDNDVTDIRGHGTHVSGIAVGYAADEDGAVKFTGAAPGAQLLSMKVFMDGELGTSSDIYFAALEDAYLLGADVINMSLGSQNGFTFDPELEGEVFGNIYQTLEDAGVVMCVAAGNESSMAEGSSCWAGPGKVTSDYADFGVVGTPSTYVDNNSVASVESLRYPTFVFTVDGRNFDFTDSSADALADGLWMTTFSGKKLDYVMVDGFGTVDDYKAAKVKGKIAVVARGELSFEEKVENAYNAGAIGVIVTNNEPGALNMQMSIETFEVPAVLTTMEAGEAMAKAKKQTLTVPADQQVLDNPDAWKMSGFSSWGPTPDLTLKPTITSVGGDVYSAWCGDESDVYETIGGTSMATPNMAGNYATLLQALEEKGVTDKVERMAKAKDLMESSALILNDENGLPYSPRRQGAGLGDVSEALNAYLRGTYVEEPLVELGDDPKETGVYKFTLTLTNNNKKPVTYTPSAVVLRDTVVADEDGNLYNALTSEKLDAKVKFSKNTLTIPGHKSRDIDVTVTLSKSAMAQMKADFPNGGFVEGYVTFTNKSPHSDDRVHATFMGFFGDWTQAPVLEQYDFRDAVDARYWLATNSPDGEHSYLNYGLSYTDLLEMNTDVSLAFLTDAWGRVQTVAGDNMVDFAPYKEQHINLSTVGFFADEGMSYATQLVMLPSLLRNAEALTVTIADKESGEIYFTETNAYQPKAAFEPNQGVWQNYGMFAWDGTDLNGEYLPTGTVATVSYDAVIPYGHTEKNGLWSFDVTIDSELPVIESAAYDPHAETVTVTASDNQYLQVIQLQPDEGETMTQVFSPDEAGETITAVFDVSDLECYDARIIIMDYATNQMDANVELLDKTVPATVILSINGEETVIDDMKIGDKFVFPEYTGELPNDWQFVKWVPASYARVEPDNVWDIYPYWMPGDRTRLNEESQTYYALFAKGDWVENHPMKYDSYWVQNDYSGNMAIVGYGLMEVWGGETMGDFENPYALRNDLGTQKIQELDDAEIGEYVITYSTDAPGLYFELERLDSEKYEYTIKVPGEEKYLALEGTELTYEDTVSGKSTWTICNWDLQGMAQYTDTLIKNLAQPQMTLKFDPETEEMKVFDEDVPVIDENGDEVSVHEQYQIYLHKQVPQDFIPEYYTTNPEIVTEVDVVLNLHVKQPENGFTETVTIQVPANSELTVEELNEAIGLDQHFDESNADKFDGWYTGEGWKQYQETKNTENALETVNVGEGIELNGVVRKGQIVAVRAIVNGKKDEAKVVWKGKAAHGDNLVDFLNENAEIELPEGYSMDKWYNWDWSGHKYTSKTTVNGYTKVEVYMGKSVPVCVYASVDGVKEEKSFWSGKAPHGIGINVFLNNNVKETDRAGYTASKWFKGDSPQWKFADTDKMNDWVNVLVKFTSK